MVGGSPFTTADKPPASICHGLFCNYIHTRDKSHEGRVLFQDMKVKNAFEIVSCVLPFQLPHDQMAKPVVSQEKFDYGQCQKELGSKRELILLYRTYHIAYCLLQAMPF